MYPNNWEAVHVDFKLRNVRRIYHFSSVPECANIPGRVTINDLPSELVANITRHISSSISGAEADSGFPDNEDFSRYNSRSLLQLALCCRYPHGLVEPILYESFHYNPKKPHKGFLLFLMQILERPDLAKWVRVFHVDGTETPNLDEDLKAARKKIAEVGTTAEECYEWAVAFEQGNLNAMIALVLTLTPNLQVLDIDMWARPNSMRPILRRVLDLAGRLQRERQLGHPLALWGLKKVVVRYCYDGDKVGDLPLMSLLMIPTLETLSATDQEAANGVVEPTGWTDAHDKSLEAASQGNNLWLSNMKDLSLSFIAMIPSDIFRLLRCCPNLKRLYYEAHVHLPENLEEYRGFNLMARASCLNPHLEDLTILNKECSWSSIMSSSASSLKSLKRLRRLETNWENFTDRGHIDGETIVRDFPSSQSVVDAIPRSLEQLRIRGDPFDHYSKEDHDSTLAIIYKLPQKKNLPALKSLDFGWKGVKKSRMSIPRAYGHPFTDDEIVEIFSWCQEAGVEMILLPPSPRYIKYRKDDNGKGTRSDTNVVEHIVHYPYDDYERIWKENGFDL